MSKERVRAVENMIDKRIDKLMKNGVLPTCAQVVESLSRQGSFPTGTLTEAKRDWTKRNEPGRELVVQRVLDRRQQVTLPNVPVEAEPSESGTDPGSVPLTSANSPVRVDSLVFEAGTDPVPETEAVSSPQGSTALARLARETRLELLQDAEGDVLFTIRSLAKLFDKDAESLRRTLEPAFPIQQIQTFNARGERRLTPAISSEHLIPIVIDLEQRGMTEELKASHNDFKRRATYFHQRFQEVRTGLLGPSRDAGLVQRISEGFRNLIHPVQSGVTLIHDVVTSLVGMATGLRDQVTLVQASNGRIESQLARALAMEKPVSDIRDGKRLFKLDGSHKQQMRGPVVTIDTLTNMVNNYLKKGVAEANKNLKAGDKPVMVEFYTSSVVLGEATRLGVYEQDPWGCLSTELKGCYVSAVKITWAFDQDAIDLTVATFCKHAGVPNPRASNGVQDVIAPMLDPAYGTV